MTSLRICVASLFLALCSTAAGAHEFKKGDIVIGNPWTRATPGGATIGVGYLTITNNGTTTDRLTGGAFDGAAKVEIHEMKMANGMMKMRELPDGVTIEPGETVKFEPQSYHLMFRGLSKPIAQGPNVKGTLTFKNAGSIAIDYKVESLGATKSSEHEHSDHDHHAPE
jgi:copper(I)-binding protein